MKFGRKLHPRAKSFSSSSKRTFLAARDLTLHDTTLDANRGDHELLEKRNKVKYKLESMREMLLRFMDEDYENDQESLTERRILRSKIQKYENELNEYQRLISKPVSRTNHPESKS